MLSFALRRLVPARRYGGLQLRSGAIIADQHHVYALMLAHDAQALSHDSPAHHPIRGVLNRFAVPFTGE